MPHAPEANLAYTDIWSPPQLQDNHLEDIYQRLSELEQNFKSVRRPHDATSYLTD
jgi:hypothetical protein